MKIANLFIALLVASSGAIAGGPQWAWDAGVQTNNGAITVKSVSGATTYNVTQNPTGAVAKLDQNSATQPATIVVQATATLPIRAEGDPCTQATSGVSPNQFADEGQAITADRTKILTCRSGVWTASSGLSSVMSVSSGGWKTSAAVICPANFTMTGGSCDMYRGGDGREINPRVCAPSGNGYYCAEGNGGYCVARAVCVKS